MKLLYLFVILVLVSCKPTQRHPTQSSVYKRIEIEKNQLRRRVFLIGDAGKADTLTSLFATLQSKLNQNPEAYILFLGDNIYPYGLPPKESKLYTTYRTKSQIHLQNQLDVVKHHARDKIIFLTGNHDWGKPKDRSFVLEQEQFLMQHQIRLLPPNACSTPSLVQLADSTILICLDTQYLIQKQKYEACTPKENTQIYAQLDSLLTQYHDYKVIIAGHHLLESDAAHGGRFHWTKHFFPLTDFSKKLYIPLPILGSLYVLGRKLGLSEQDIANKRYSQMRQELYQIFEKYPGLIYVAGHEHTLQYHQEKSISLINSGAGSKQTFVKRKGKAIFAYDKKGFAQLDILKNGIAHLYFFDEEGKLLFSSPL